ncbi:MULTISPECIES: YraN family protein [Aphanothece]|uniref:YraN family protein n=1 Tax=Aphanothece TaxID=1121 RepID=UPI0039856030
MLKPWMELQPMASRGRTALLGDWAEQRALRLLRTRGWVLLSRQWRCRWGELDLVVAKGERLLLVEVKGRGRPGPDGWGRAALGRAKRLRLERAWSCWLVEHPGWANATAELVFALVPLPPSRRPVRWIRAWP